MRTKYLLMLMAFFIISLSKGQNKWGFETMVNTMLTNVVDTISSQELSEMLKNEDVLLLDSRELSEYEVSHLEGAKFIGYDNPEYEVLEGIDKSTPIVVYCSIGKRSENIGIELEKLGFTNVFNLFGGIFDWTNRGFPVLDSEGNEVKKVHPYSTTWGVWVNNYDKEYGTE
ncbi:rhodanese-like domain-containing protein [Cryomorphaceae bacterium 1068]|nr:rhodanese-like domain-containing protein [Cryomorphaceae bacterium 1068]